MNDEWKAYKFSGIYAITCMVNEKVYVGQSQNIAKRVRDHRSPLSKSLCIRRAIDKYGWDAFEISVLERVEDLSLLNEQYWIDTLDVCNPQKGYNVAPFAGSGRGMKASEETKEKMRNRVFSAETRAKMSASALTRPPCSEETRAKIGAIAKAMLPESRERCNRIFAATKGF
jgi:group I intron endonuclease